jgi:hypothetical protein
MFYMVFIFGAKHCRLLNAVVEHHCFMSTLYHFALTTIPNKVQNFTGVLCILLTYVQENMTLLLCLIL